MSATSFLWRWWSSPVSGMAHAQGSRRGTGPSTGFQLTRSYIIGSGAAMHPSTQPRDTYVDARRKANAVFCYRDPATVTSLLPTISVGPRSCHHRPLACLGRQKPSIHSPVWLLDSHFSIKFLSLLAHKTPYYAVSIRNSLFAINLHHQPFYTGSHLHGYHDSG